MVDPDGKNLVVLSKPSDSYHGGCLAWSPDSRKIAFTSSGCYGDGKIHVINVESDSEITLSSEVESDPAWSPDGRKIAFVKERKIHVIDVESGKETTLANGGYPAWSPDGKKIAFVKAIITLPSQPSSVGGWTSLSLAPSIMENSALTWDRGDYICAYGGGYQGYQRVFISNNYYRYSISNNSWESIAPIPENDALPHGLICLDENSLYTFDRGVNRKDIWRYSVSTNSWSRITSFPDEYYPYQAGPVGVIVAGKKYIYIHSGRTSFWRYSISDNSWEKVREGLWCPPSPNAMI